MAAFSVDIGLSKRLGYSRILSKGKDFSLSESHHGAEMPSIICSSDHGTIMSALRSPDVTGIIFKHNALDKKAVEKAAESSKTIFIPIFQLTCAGISERRSIARDMRKLIYYAHKARARVRLISLAESGEQLLSVSQMRQIAALLIKEGSEELVIGDFA